jgi:hypothetical protein
MGEPADTPDEAVAGMVKRRLKETSKRSYTEIHRQPHIIRRSEHHKEKMTIRTI